MEDRSDFALRVTENGQRPVVMLAGELDALTAPRLQAALREFSGEHVTLDLSDVTFMDSTAIRVLVAAHKKTFLSGGSIVLQGVQPASRKVMEITGLAGSMYFDGHTTAA
jgi:anti-anti-sigma factor